MQNVIVRNKVKNLLFSLNIPNTDVGFYSINAFILIGNILLWKNKMYRLLLQYQTGHYSVFYFSRLTLHAVTYWTDWTNIDLIFSSILRPLHSFIPPYFWLVRLSWRLFAGSFDLHGWSSSCWNDTLNFIHKQCLHNFQRRIHFRLSFTSIMLTCMCTTCGIPNTLVQTLRRFAIKANIL